MSPIELLWHLGRTTTEVSVQHVRKEHAAQNQGVVALPFGLKEGVDLTDGGNVISADIVSP